MGLVRQNLGRVLVALFIAFAAYSNINLIVRNNYISNRLEEAKQKTLELELRNKKRQLLIEYYQTSSYQDVEARRRLALKKPEEKVLIVTGLPPDAFNSNELSDFAHKGTPTVTPDSESNLIKWWRYFFD